MFYLICNLKRREFLIIREKFDLIFDLNEGILEKNDLDFFFNLNKLDIFSVLGKKIIFNFNHENLKKNSQLKKFYGDLKKKNRESLCFLSWNFKQGFLDLFNKDSILDIYGGDNKEPIFILKEIYSKFF